MCEGPVEVGSRTVTETRRYDCMWIYNYLKTKQILFGKKGRGEFWGIRWER